ncbi:MAG: dipeptide epimerase [Pseudomonadota bacterium]
MRLSVRSEYFELYEPFGISNHVWNSAEVCTVELEEDGVIGRGEGAPVVYHGESAETLTAQIEAIRAEIEQGIDRQKAAELLPPGGALCALDCALWDLEARRSAQPPHQLARLKAPTELDSAITITLKSTDAMAAQAERCRDYPLLKVKLGGADDEAAIRAIREVAPHPRITVDANTGWSLERLTEFEPLLLELGVELIEQPMPPEHDDALIEFTSRIPIAADESCQTVDDVEGLIGKYDTAVIKLDKAGGLTGAIDLMKKARESNLQLMVSCMIGTSLGMAPARLIGTYCKTVDLDAPMNLKVDRDHPIPFTNGRMHATPAQLWGGSA